MSGLRLATAVALCLLLAACAGHRTRAPAGSPSPPSAPRSDRLPPDTARPQSERYRQNDDDGPAAPPIDVSKIPEPVPKVEPRARYGNKETYSVLGRTYRLLPDASGYAEQGVASWYGNKFHGYMTSSFEPYDMYAFSAAHKTLPLPSYARVTNLANGKSVVVRVNDRGPFHENRIIDLSYAAAVKIGVWPKGTALVDVRAIDPKHPETDAADVRTAAALRRTAPAGVQIPAASTGPGASTSPIASAGSIASPGPATSARAATTPNASAATAAPPAAGAAPRIYLQIGSFGERDNAERAAASATRAGIAQVGIQSVAVNGHTVHRVRVGPLADVEAADAMTERIERLGLGPPRVAVER